MSITLNGNKKGKGGCFMKTQKKIATITDFTGFGRCSLAVTMPILSVMKVQCCPVVTSILSNHSGFPSFFFDDYTEKMNDYIAEWKKLNLHFDGIYTGFLGSKEQISIVSKFLSDFHASDTIVLIDPIMGDHGKAYKTYTKEMCEEMKQLVQHADILTPNLTEACILTDMPYQERMNQKELQQMAEKLCTSGAKKIVITGIVQGQFLANFCYEKETKIGKMLRTKKVGTSRPGTGDMFASILAADAVNGVSFETSIKKASKFIQKCILKSEDFAIPIQEGVCFEEYLSTLH